MTVILALDQGTTSSRAIVFDQAGNLQGVAQREFAQLFPNAGWVEHDPQEIWQSQLDVARQVLDQCGLAASDVSAIGIANQRETTLLWERKTGQPVCNAIVWQDRRTADFCKALSTNGYSDFVQKTSGLLIDPYFCASKLNWMLDHVDGLRARAEAGELAFGTVDCWLLWNLTGGRVHSTDVTNASRTMLFDIHQGDWSDELLSLFDIPRSILPSVFPSSHVYGETDAKWFGTPIRIGSAAGDQQAALFGQNCSRLGMAKNTYGTGCFMLMNIGNRPTTSKCKLLTTVGCGLEDQKQYALEGSIFSGGATVQWLRDGLGIISDSADVESLAAQVDNSDGVYLVPAFAGLGAPYWDAHARGTIVGMTRGTTRAHLARAALEGIAYQVADVLDAMTQDSQVTVDELRVDGGAATNDLLMQFQADILQVPVVRPKIIETTALGAAYLAGLAVGYWKDVGEIQDIWQADSIFQPLMSNSEVKQRRARWQDALQRSRHWASEA